MALSIKDPEADQLARDLARLAGESLTGAVTRALTKIPALYRTNQAAYCTGCGLK